MPNIPTYKEVNFVAFKIRTLQAILLMCMAGSGLYIFSILAGFISFSSGHLLILIGFLVTSVLLYFWLEKQPQKILLISKLLAIFAMITFSFSAFQQTGNCYRFIWFLPLIIFTFFFINSRYGIVTTIASVSVLITFYLGDYSIPGEALGTLTISFIAVAYLADHYSDQISAYETQIKEQNQELQKMVTHDAMTGILNRYGIVEYGTHYCNLAQRESDVRISLIIFDIDKFKNINDTYGHLCGDQALIFLTETIKENIRKTDLFGRMGGDEFILLLPNTPKENAKQLIDAIRQKLSMKPFDTGKKELFIEISAGVTERTADTENFDTLFIEADKALYRAKEQGRNCSVIYESGF